MSYDVYVSCHTCGNALNHANTSVPGGLDGILIELGCPLREWNGKSGVEVLPRLQYAVQTLSDVDEFPDWKFKYPDRGGGWEPADIAKTLLTVMRDAICREPEAVIHVA